VNSTECYLIYWFFPTTLTSICDHNAVTLSPLDLALLDFGAYVSDAVASNALHFFFGGGNAIVSTRKKHDSFMKVDDFSKVAVRPQCDKSIARAAKVYWR
jgi:hypothetical protein